jgi:transposase
MKKTFENKRQEVEYLLNKQKIRSVTDLDSYKLDICHTDSAGIDLGSKEIYVAIPPTRAAELDVDIVHKFATHTQDLLACRDLLTYSGINTVSMESTSVYWVTLFDILTESGIEVCLVNPKKFRMVPGRKTDVLDCQWLQILHTYGLLRGSFHPDNQIKQLRTYMRHRDKLICEQGRFVQRMQKAMIQMNLLLHNVIDDITGVSGIRIIESILKGERDPEKLVKLCDGRIKATDQQLINSLQGYYKEDQLFLLQQNYDSYCFFSKQIEKTDKEIEALLKTFSLKRASKDKKPENHKPKNIRSKNSLKTKDNIEDMLFRILGTDLSSLPGFRGQAILQVISEVGYDMSKFPNASHFASYLGFVPHNKITGGQIINSKTDRIKSSAAQTFRKVIPAISRSNTALGGFYRRLAPRIGKGQAIVACCRKLSMMFYNALKFGIEYVEHGNEKYIEQQKKYKAKALMKLAKELNMEIVEKLA